MKEIKIKNNVKIRKTLHHSSYSSKNSQQSTQSKWSKLALLAFAHCFSSTNRSSKNAKNLGIFDNFLTACTRAYYFPRNHGLDPPYVAVFPDPSLKSARENSSALESRVLHNNTLLLSYKRTFSDKM